MDNSSQRLNEIEIHEENYVQQEQYEIDYEKYAHSEQIQPSEKSIKQF
jgi:hypothetical protein